MRPSSEAITVNAANIDRFVTVLRSHRELNDTDSTSELVTLMKAAEHFEEFDLRLMFAIMLQREADRR